MATIDFNTARFKRLANALRAAKIFSDMQAQEELDESEISSDVIAVVDDVMSILSEDYSQYGLRAGDLDILENLDDLDIQNWVKSTLGFDPI